MENEATEELFLDEMFEALLFADESQDKQATKSSEKRSVGSSRRFDADGTVKILQADEVEMMFDADSYSPSEQLREPSLSRTSLTCAASADTTLYP